MAHRLLHTLVVSSALSPLGLGCAFSHREPILEREPEPLDLPGVTDEAATVVDAGPEESGASPEDVGVSAEDAGARAPDAEAADAGPDPMDLRFCEPGWPTTKASYCYTLDESEMPPRVVCCNSWGGEDGGRSCCLGEE